jgi:DNA-binding HxlR family transcriptional regulator
MKPQEEFGPRGVLELVADKWSILVIYHLHNKTLRHSQLKRLLDGVSSRMLTVTLRKLEENGLVHRKVYPVVPPKVEYSLTELGRTLVKPLQILCEWSDHHLNDIQEAREQYHAMRIEENA